MLVGYELSRGTTDHPLDRATAISTSGRCDMHPKSDEEKCGCGLASLHGSPHQVRVPKETWETRVVREVARGLAQGLEDLKPHA